MKDLNFRIKIEPSDPFYEFDDKAIDFTKKARKPKKGSPKRKRPKKR